VSISESGPVDPDEVPGRRRSEMARTLASIEAGLRADDPRLTRRMRAWPVTPGTGTPAHRRLIRLTSAWTLLAVVLLAVAVPVHSPVLAGLGCALILLIPAVVVSSAADHLRRPRRPKAGDRYAH
jgi:hypothetical protein